MPSVSIDFLPRPFFSLHHHDPGKTPKGTYLWQFVPVLAISPGLNSHTPAIILTYQICTDTFRQAVPVTTKVSPYLFGVHNYCTDLYKSSVTQLPGWGSPLTNNLLGYLLGSLGKAHFEIPWRVAVFPSATTPTSNHHHLLQPQ